METIEGSSPTMKDAAMNVQPARSDRPGIIWGILRLFMGWTFFWAFIDKLFGLGFATCRDAKTAVVTASCPNAWINGGSPTDGFLKFATSGPFADFYKGLAGNTIVEWLFMLGLAFVGTAFLLGIFTRLASYSGALMLVLMYTAAFMPPDNNPFLDQHFVFALLLIGLAHMKAGKTLGLGGWWANTTLVRKYPILE